MMQIDPGKRKIGVSFNNNKQAEIVLWAPKANSVSIQLNNESVSLELKEEAYGYWTLTTDKIKPGDRYKFLLNREAAYPDPASLLQPDGVHNASEAVDLNQHQWLDEDWNNPPLKDYILYELHAGTFTQPGTFEALEHKLDYLKELGVNAIEIMPVAQFSGARNWGYDGVYPFAVQDSYGGAEGLQKLVDACHSKGIAVVLDVVYNHMGPEGNYLEVYGHYFTGKYNTPWGKALNFDDDWCDGVRHYFIENVLMWFRDFHIDALRMDAVHAIKDFSPVHILKEIKQQVNQLMAHTGRTHHLIVELDLNDNRFINPIEQCGFGMDAQWIDEFHHALRVSAGGDRSGYYQDFTGLEHLAKSYKDAYVFDGQYSEHRKKHFGVKADNNPGEQFIVFAQNHDQVGNRMLGERISDLVSFEMQKLMAGAVMCAPFIPMLFMGEEYGETNPFLYFVSHTDEALAAAVREGRKREFAAFHLEGEAPDPVAEKTYNQSKLQWQLLQQEPHKTLLQYYRHLIKTRKTEPALFNLNRNNLEVETHKNEEILVLHRWHDNDYVLCIMNFSKLQRTYTLPAKATGWINLVNSARPEFNGANEAPQQLLAGAEIMLAPESFLIYKNQND